MASLAIFLIGGHIVDHEYGQEPPQWAITTSDDLRITLFASGVLAVLLTPFGAWAVHRKLVALKDENSN